MDPKDNEYILSLLRHRMAKGMEEYKQGVDTSDVRYQWTKEALEEILDGMIYVAAALIRLRNDSSCSTCSCNTQVNL